MVLRLRHVELVYLTEAAEAREPFEVQLPLAREPRLIERHQLAEVLGGLVRQAATFREAQRHAGRQVAIAVHDQLQVVGRAQTRAARERAQ
jgi:predicted lipid carrier protein YhbT